MLLVFDRATLSLLPASGLCLNQAVVGLNYFTVSFDIYLKDSFKKCVSVRLLPIFFLVFLKTRPSLIQKNNWG